MKGPPDSALEQLEDLDYYRNLEPHERVQLMVAVSRAAAAMLRAHPNPELAASYRDPLPASTVAALARLRRISKDRGDRQDLDRPTDE
jgi:hypothetical protein